MITAQNISKSYGDLNVLKNISIDVQESEIVSIVGKSGAGKSTFLQILGTLDNADSGSVEIAGVNIDRLSGRSLADFRNKHIGFIFQFHHLLPEFTAVENVRIPASIAGIGRKEAEMRSLELLDYLGLKDRSQHKPGELSGGEQQRVAVARALVNRPSIVLADEPTGNLDSESSNDLHRLFLKMREDFEQTFVIVTHNASLANLSDRQLNMSDGTLTR